jgi:O-antigen/teichoic acid export membrane protein
MIIPEVQENTLSIDSKKNMLINLSSFGKETLIYAVGNIAIRASSFLLIPLFTHFLSIQDYGLLSILYLTIEIMFIFMHMGLRTALLRFAQNSNSEVWIGKLLGTSILLNVIGGFIITAFASLIFCNYFSSILHTEQIRQYVALASCAALIQSLYIILINYYRARHEAKKYLASGVSAAFLLIIFNICFLAFLKFGIKGVLLAQIAAYGIIFIIVFYKLFRQTPFGFSLKLSKEMVYFGFPLIFAMSSDLIMHGSSYYFLSYFKRLDDVAIYSLGCKLASVAEISLISSFQVAYEPFVFSNIDKPGIGELISGLFSYLMLCFAFLAVAIILVSRDMITIIAPQRYSPAYLVIICVLPIYAFKGVYYVGSALLTANYKTKVIGITLSIFAILSIVLNYFLIPILGIFGAIISEGVITIAHGTVILAMGMKVFPIKLEKGRLGFAGCLLTLFILLNVLLKDLSGILFYSINIGAISVAVFFLSKWVLTNESEKIFVKKTLKKLTSRMP